MLILPKKAKKGLILLFFLVIIGFTSYFLSLNHNPPKVLYDQDATIGKIYSLNPLIKSDHFILFESESIFPHTKFSPKSIFYLITYFIEKINLKYNKSLFSLYAQKRIAELKIWGKELNTLGNLSETNKLIDWWKKKQIKVWKLNKTGFFSNWESILAIYVSYYEDEIQEISQLKNKTNNLIILSGSLKYNQLFLEYLITRSNKSTEDKKYLTTLTQNILVHLNEKISEVQPIFNLSPINYSLEEIINNKDYGIYNLSIINREDLPYILENIDYLKIDKQIVNPDNTKTISEDNPWIFKNIKIAKGHPYLSLVLKSISSPKEEKKWDLKISKDGVIYKYILKLYPTIEKKNLLLVVDYRFINPVSIQLEKIFNKEKNEFQQFFNKDLFVNKKSQLFKIVSFDQDKNTYYQLVLTSEKPISTNELDDFHIQIRPVFDPEIALEKMLFIPEKKFFYNLKKVRNNLYTITVVNSTFDYDDALFRSLRFFWKVKQQKELPDGYTLTIEYFPEKIFLLLSTSILVLLILCFIQLSYTHNKNIDKKNNKTFFYNLLKSRMTRTYKLIKYLILIPLSRFNNFLLKRVMSIRLLFLFLMLLGFFFDFIILVQTLNLIIYINIISWIFVLISYQIEERTNFILAFFFIIFCPFFLIINKPLIAEKTAVWAFSFLIIGTIHVFIIKLKTRQKDSINLKQLPKILLTDIKNLFFIKFFKIEFKQLLLYLLLYLQNSYIIIIIYCRKNRRNIFILIFYVFLIFIILALTFFSFLQIRRLLNYNLQRMSLNPIVNNIQPTLTYHGNIVVIKGHGFGSKDSEKVYLMTKYGEVRPNYWSDKKIYFSIPFDWPIGVLSFWIKKDIIWKGKRIITETKPFMVKLISTTDGWDIWDDKYFEQLKHLDKEVLGLNGY